MFPVAGFALRVIKKDYFRLTTRNTQLVTRNIIFQRKNNMLAEIDNKLSI